MKKNSITSVLSAGTIIGAVIGFVLFFKAFTEAVKNITANQYIKHKAYRLIALDLHGLLIKWMSLIVITAFSFFILWFLWKLFLADIVVIRIKKENAFRIFIAGIICAVFSLYGGWAINHYFLPHKFHPASLSGDVIILFFTIFLVWALIKVRWRTIALALFIPLLTINLGIIIDSRINIPDTPNIIMILSDTLRKDHLGCYGHKRNTTPNIDLFAENAILIKNAFAQSPSTKPSVASLFTSKYPSQHHVTYNEDSLNLSYMTLAEILKQNKYMTAGFIENSVIDKRFGFSQGFSEWIMDDRRHKVATSEPMTEFDEKISSWLDKYRGRPFFLYMHYIDPHNPHNAPKPFNNFFSKEYTDRIPNFKGKSPEIIKRHFYKNKRDLEHLISFYDNEIRYIDSRFGELINKLKKLDILDNSIVIFLSDHGEGFLEHDNFAHSYSVYGELINIPLIIRFPKLSQKDYTEDHVQHVDIMPTIMHVLKINTDALLFEGRNILAESNNKAAIFSEHLRRGWGIPQQCIISGNWKLIYGLESGDYSLFDIKKDPLDYENIIGLHSEIADTLKSYLLKWRTGLTDKKEALKVDLDNEFIEKLKSLGYIK
ncbi:sulfatase [Elusimicrobiota bacterium]